MAVVGQQRDALCRASVLTKLHCLNNMNAQSEEVLAKFKSLNPADRKQAVSDQRAVLLEELELLKAMIYCSIFSSELPDQVLTALHQLAGN